jgi:hypothetical protein
MRPNVVSHLYADLQETCVESLFGLGICGKNRGDVLLSDSKPPELTLVELAPSGTGKRLAAWSRSWRYNGQAGSCSGPEVRLWEMRKCGLTCLPATGNKDGLRVLQDTLGTPCEALLDKTVESAVRQHRRKCFDCPGRDSLGADQLLQVRPANG